MAIRHLYVHVPFCPTVCPFCSFEVTERRGGLVAGYLDRIAVEAEALAAQYPHRLETIYIGGGTPSHLRDAELARLFGTIRGAFGDAAVGAAAEVTMEVHPATASRRRLERWIELGVNRFSVGVQSFDDAVLDRLGRGHSAAVGRRALELALEVASDAGSTADGLPNVRVAMDVMTAIEAQDPAADLAAAAASGVDHISAYTLTIEPGTPFAAREVEVDPEAEGRALDAASEVLGAAGLVRYEVSNHARRGHESRHNLAYWDNAWWSSLGPGASSHLPPSDADLGVDCDLVAIRRTSAALGPWLDGHPGEVDPRDTEGYVIDGVLAGLRRVTGVDLVELGSKVGLGRDEVESRWGPAVEEVDVKRWVTVERSGGALSLVPTSAGMLVLDQVAAAFLSPLSGSRPGWGG